MNIEHFILIPHMDLQGFVKLCNLYYRVIPQNTVHFGYEKSAYFKTNM